QIDLRTTPLEGLSVNALYGVHTEDDADGAASSATAEQDWNHYGLTVTQDLSKHVYLAGRYSAAEVDKWEPMSGGASMNSGTVDRIQLGGGVQIFDGFLGKLEYVQEEATNFTQDAALGVDVTKAPKFSGLIAEFSMTY
ncbi:MAG: hypothetical protein ABEK50_08915, partial [bacterium]